MWGGSDVALFLFPLFTPSADPASAARRPAPEPSAVGGEWRARAFTLIELLVAMTVTLILVVALMQIFNAAANTWQHGEAQVDAYREARGALQFMARDLSATLQASYAQTNGAPGSTPAPPAMPTLALQHASASYDAAGGPVNEEVYCLTNIPNSGASSLCAVGYYCQWMPDIRPKINNCPQAYALMRQCSDSNGTFLRIKAAAGAGPLTFDQLFSQTVTPVPSVTQLAAYIWDLRFRIDTDLNERTFPDGNAATAPMDHSTPAPGYPYRGDAAKPYPPRLPAYVEIRFKALSDIAGRRLEGTGIGVDRSTWNDTGPGFTPSGPYRSIIQPNAQQFVLRVPLINATP